jgi:hypothetical protein
MVASGSALGASRVNGMRASIMQQRGYASEGSSKKGGSGGLLFLSKFYQLQNRQDIHTHVPILV